MQYLNIYLPTLAQPEFACSTEAQAGTWIKVLRFCASVENGGTIKGAKTWTPRQWLQTLGVTKKAVDAASQLLTWNGDDLVAWAYPIDQEAVVRLKREAGRVGGLKSGAVRAKQKRSTPSSTREADLQRNVIEKEERKKSNSSVGAEAAGPVIPFHTNTEQGSEETDSPFQALARLESPGAEPLTRSASRRVGVALADIRKACPGVTGGEIRRRGANYKTHFSNAVLTPHALASHWGRCDQPATYNSGAKGGRPELNGAMMR